MLLTSGAEEEEDSGQYRVRMSRASTQGLQGQPFIQLCPGETGRRATALVARRMDALPREHLRTWGTGCGGAGIPTQQLGGAKGGVAGGLWGTGPLIP